MRTTIHRLQLTVVLLLGTLIGGAFMAVRTAEAYFPAETVSAIVSSEVTCAATATQLPSLSTMSFTVRVPDAGATVYVGGSGVTTANGFPIYAKDAVTYSLANTNKLFCVVAAATQEMQITGESR